MSDMLALRGGKPAIREPLPTIKNATGRLFGEEEKRLVLEALESGSLSCLYGTMAGRFERLDAPLLLLVADARFRFVRSAKTQKTAVNRHINIFREPLDDRPGCSRWENAVDSRTSRWRSCVAG